MDRGAWRAAVRGVTESGMAACLNNNKLQPHPSRLTLAQPQLWSVFMRPLTVRKALAQQAPEG